MTALAREFDGLVAKFGAELEKEAAAISPEAGVLGAAWHSLWKTNASILGLAAEHKKPSPEVLKVLQDGLVAAGKPIADARANLDFPLPAHAQGMSDASLGMLWTGAEAPLESIEAAKEACDFYLNKVRKQSKDEGDAHHMAFANLIRDGLAALHDFVKDNEMKLGLRWAADGTDLDAAAAAAAAKGTGGTSDSVSQAGGAAASSSAASTASKAPAGGAGSASGSGTTSPVPAAASSGAASLPAKGPASPPPAAKAQAAASSSSATTPLDPELKAALDEVQAKARALEARIAALEAAGGSK